MRFEKGWLIGDPHLGKKFEIGVPPQRRGEREAGQLANFKGELEAAGDMVVMVGDLFDNPYVSHAVVKAAIDAVLAAADRRPETDFVMMAGNHDMPRKVTTTAAFSVFQRAVDRRLPNVYVLTEPRWIEGVAFFPWEWARTAAEQVSWLCRQGEGFNGKTVAAVGHWDLSSFGGEDRHLAPVLALRNAFGEVPCYSGHYHTPGDYQIAGRTVHCTGSLEPYSHGEDPDGLIYVTMTLAEALAADPASIVNKHVRVVLAPGEEKPQLDVLALTAQVQAAASVEQLGNGSALDHFNWNGIVSAALAPLDQEVRSFIEERLPSHGQELGGAGD